ncbi:hypothetical protein K2173_005212 [Erythroxylum novogranatense]|uniref:Uncharacterized protein n=1 Tax=Erythroxylum novogranatense TaxID=1862640 RepID=A0AAV8TU50_9ROSI|nr:hypothetical protein K2173_005212 [Erythroxylum novogranatense]
MVKTEQTEIKELEFVDDSVELLKDCASRDSCTSSASIATNSGPCKKGNDDVVALASDYTTSNLKVQGFAIHVGPNVDKDHNVGSLPTGNCDSVEWSKLTQESISFGFTRCTTLKSGDYANVDMGANLLKACSCSLCLKGDLNLYFL